MHIGIQNLLSREQNIDASIFRTYLDKLGKLILRFKKNTIENYFLANHEVVICRTCKNAAF